MDERCGLTAAISQAAAVHALTEVPAVELSPRAAVSSASKIRLGRQAPADVDRIRTIGKIDGNSLHGEIKQRNNRTLLVTKAGALRVYSGHGIPLAHPVGNYNTLPCHATLPVPPCKPLHLYPPFAAAEAPTAGASSAVCHTLDVISPRAPNFQQRSGNNEV